MFLLCLELIFVLHASSKTEITDFQVAILVKEQVAWLKISMNDVCRVDKQHSSEYLVDEILNMIVS